MTEAECGNIDLAERFGPVVNQSSYSWCWVFATRDLMSFAAGRLDDRFAPFDVASAVLSTTEAHFVAAAKAETDFKRSADLFDLQNYVGLDRFNNRGVPLISRGLSSMAAVVYSYGLQPLHCTEKSYFGASNVRLEEPPQSPAIFESSLNTAVSTVFGNLKQRPRALSIHLKKGRYSPEFTDLLGDTNRLPWMRDFDEIRRAYAERELPQLRSIVNNRCEGHWVHDPKFDIRTFSKQTTPEGQEAVATYASFILNHEYPVGIVYDPRFLSSKAVTETLAYHVSVLVGTRWDSERQTCEFKVRNSWGKDCSVYNPPYNEARNCEDGNVWITSDDLKKHLHEGITVFAEDAAK